MTPTSTILIAAGAVAVVAVVLGYAASRKTKKLLVTEPANSEDSEPTQSNLTANDRMLNLPATMQFGFSASVSGSSRILLTMFSDKDFDTDMVIDITGDEIRAFQVNGGDLELMGMSKLESSVFGKHLHFQLDYGELVITDVATHTQLFNALPVVLRSNNQVGPYQYASLEGNGVFIQ